MAIIYTYPKLTNPQGNELIVVSDVNNKNSTRLITIADIASLVPGGGGGGCSNAITGILTGAGNYIAPLCNEVTFAGSGINISADQATATVTFTVPPVTIQCADQDRNVGGIAVEPGFLGTPTASETGSIYPVQVTDDCVAAVRIPDSQVDLSCATTNQIGGIKAYPTSVNSGSWPQPANEGTYYPLEAVNFLEALQSCVGAVKIPCAGTLTAGVIKIGGVVEGADPVLGSGTATAVQVNDNCQAFVNVPSGGDPFVLECATPTALGGIKASKAEGIEVPDPASTGNYYPVQTTSSEDDDDCTAVVRIPTSTATIDCADTTTIGGIKVGSTGSQLTPDITELESSPLAVEVNADCQAYVQVPTATTPGNGQITIAAGTGLTGGGNFTVNQAGNSTITLNAQSASGETGWSPMPIYAGNTVLPQQEKDLTMVAHATADATMQINRVKLMLPGTVPGAQGPVANVDAKFAVAVYDGSLTDVINSGANPPLLGEFIYNPLGVAVYGVKEVACTVNAGFAVEAGKDYIVCVSTQAGGPQLWGSGGTNAVQGVTFGFSAFGDSHVGFGNETQDFTAGFPANLGGDPPGIANDFPWGWRYCMHFYFEPEVSEGEGEGSEEGEVEQEKEG